MSHRPPRILLIGTADTKSDELLFLRGRIEAGGGEVLVMDVGVLDGAPFKPEIANAEVAAAAGTTTAALAGMYQRWKKARASAGVMASKSLIQPTTGRR